MTMFQRCGSDLGMLDVVDIALSRGEDNYQLHFRKHELDWSRAQLRLTVSSNFILMGFGPECVWQDYV